MKRYVCPVCGYVYEGDDPPEVCPICGAAMEEETE
jgi:rubrerythrin